MKQYDTIEKYEVEDDWSDRSTCGFVCCVTAASINQPPGDDYLARMVIETLVNDGNRAGEGMPLPAVRVRSGIYRADDFERGLKCALERGWITVSMDRFFVKLTDAGYRSA